MSQKCPTHDIVRADFYFTLPVSDLYTHSSKLPQLSEKYILHPVNKSPESILGLLSSFHILLMRKPLSSTPTISRYSTTMLCLYCIAKTKPAGPSVWIPDIYKQPELCFSSRQLFSVSSPNGKALFHVGKDSNVFSGTLKVPHIAFCLVLISLSPTLDYEFPGHTFLKICSDFSFNLRCSPLLSIYRCHLLIHHLQSLHPIHRKSSQAPS